MSYIGVTSQNQPPQNERQHKNSDPNRKTLKAVPKLSKLWRWIQK